MGVTGKDEATPTSPRFEPDIDPINERPPGPYFQELPARASPGTPITTAQTKVSYLRTKSLSGHSKIVFDWYNRFLMLSWPRIQLGTVRTSWLCVC